MRFYLTSLIAFSLLAPFTRTSLGGSDDLLAGIVRAEDERDASSPALSHGLAAGDRRVRARAALGLGRIGQARSAGPLMVRLKHEPDPEIRSAICFGLGLIGRPEATKALIEALAYDPDVTVRCRAAQALGFIPGGLPVGALIAALPPPGRQVDPVRAPLAWAVAAALVRQADDRAVEPLATIAARSRGVGRSAAVWALARLKKGGLDALHAAAESPDPFDRAWAIRGLGAQKVARPAEVVRLIADRNRLVRVHAVGAAGACRICEAVAPLTALAAGPGDPDLRIEAVNALGQIGSKTPAGLLLELRRSPGTLARAADLALARLHIADEVFFAGGPQLGTAGWTVLDWLGWVDALAAFGGAGARQRLSRLAVGLDGPIERREVVAAAAIGALANDAQPPEAATLGFHLAGRDPFHRTAAVEAVVKHRKARALPALTRAYRAALADGIDDFRAAAIQAAADLKDPEAGPLLRTAVNDPSRNVRQTALKGLAELSGMKRPIDPGRVDPGRSGADYRNAISRSRPVARIVTTAGSFEITLDAELAPLTVDNFLRLARSRYFDGLLISRVVPGFVVQMGDPRGDMSGTPGYSIRCEVSPAPYERGTVGMALSGKDTGGSQFFVTLTRQPHLDAVYPAFGRVTTGMEAVEKLTKGDRIASITIDPPTSRPEESR